MRTRPAAVLGLIAILATAPAACGSSKYNATGSGATAVSGGGGGGGSNDLAELAARASQARVKITYSQSGATTTFAQDGAGKSSYVNGDASYYTDGDTSVTCNGKGSDAKCAVAPAGGPSAATPLTRVVSGLADVDATAYGGHVSSDTIAGRDARCVTFKPADAAGFAGNQFADQNAKLTVCVDKDTGFPLRIASSSGNTATVTFEATSVGEPTASDFTPPATPEGQ